MKPLVLLVHGYNVHDPEETVGKLRTFFETRGCETIIVNYGHVGLLLRETKRKNPKVAKQVAATVNNSKLLDASREVIVVGHSNGCAIINMACRDFGAKIDKVVYVNPALKTDLSPGCECHVWHSPSDSPVKWARRMHKIPFIRQLTPTRWGRMGSTGYRGSDVLVTNYNKEHDYIVSSKEHSDVFNWHLIAYFGPLIVNAVLSDD